MQVETVTPARRGRPPLPPSERRTEPFSIRLSPTEYKAVYAFAKRHGKPLDEVLRRVLMRLVKS